MVRRLAALSREDRFLLVDTVVCTIRVRARMRVRPRSALRRDLKSPEGSPRPNGISPEKIAWSVNAVRRRCPGGSCLQWALVARRLLKRHGHHSELRFGVARPGGNEFSAHAWVECGGRVVVGNLPDLHTYSVLTEPRTAKA